MNGSNNGTQQFHKIAEVTPTEGYKLELKFASGEIRIFDVTPLLQNGLFRDLINPDVFEQVRISHGTIEWPGELDLCPQSLYQQSVPITS